MLIVHPSWNVYATDGDKDVRLKVSDPDLEAMLRALRASGFTKYEMSKLPMPGSMEWGGGVQVVGGGVDVDE
jgi:hypothetical protein